MQIFCHRGKFGCTDIGQEYLRQEDVKGAALADMAPENSEESVRAAFAAGYNVEIDVVMTKDGELVVTHTNNMVLHSKDAVEGDFASEKTWAEIKVMKTGMGGKTAPFLTYKRFLELLASFDNVVANVEIKGTIQPQDSLVEPQNPSLIERLVEKTSAKLMERIVWSSFALSNLVKMKKLVPSAKVAQLFCLPEHNGVKIYPDTDDVYMSFNLSNLEKVLSKIEDLDAVHLEIGNLEDVGALQICYASDISVRAWVLQERNPLKNEAAKQRVLDFLRMNNEYPALECDIITDYADEMKELLGGYKRIGW